MKTFFAFLTLPVIFLFCFLAAKCYVAGQYFVAYALIASWFASFTLWIQTVGGLFQKPVVVAPRVPRAYIAGAKNR
ncbi:hypothetical protein [Puia dinghuensis]|uniref:Uncharacterized protein n=1 Tax=Puia dinghuensis TaxID=1792502 RepID=A0A8J2U7U3_9BACT|nr:hypothetical protein [Puia dinghuensis]GGA85399.1 hypothetical protein GCM10011511_05550 [Puia dinghuensis]